MRDKNKSKDPRDKSDPLNPPHYTQSKIQPWDVMEDMGISKDFCLGNILKYAMRYRLKDGVKDLYKLRDYADQLIAIEEREAAK